MHVEPAWYDIPGTLRRTSLGRTSIYKALSEGKLDGRKFGKRLLISAESIDRLMASLPKFGEAA